MRAAPAQALEQPPGKALRDPLTAQFRVLLGERPPAPPTKKAALAHTKSVRRPRDWQVAQACPRALFDLERDPSQWGTGRPAQPARP